MGHVTSPPSEPFIRPPRVGDLDAVLDLLIARDIADLGQPDIDASDVLCDWEDPQIDMAKDAWVVEGDGRLSGYGLAGSGGHLDVVVHPDDEGRGLGRILLRLAEERALARAAPGETLHLVQMLGSANTMARDLLEEHGYGVGQRYWRMRVALGSTPAPAWPPGVTQSTHQPGDADRELHALIETAFSEIPGNRPESFERWRQRRMMVADFDPTSWLVAHEEDGTLVGGCVCELWPDEGSGYVAQLATRPDRRGLGLGRALLLAAFADQRRRGLRWTALDVNALNESGLRLYESVGMEVAWRTDRFEKTVVVPS